MTKKHRKKKEYKIKARQNTKLGHWRLVKKLGHGGNGEVWEANQPGMKSVAIKILKRIDQTSLARFTAETEALKIAKDIDGVIPLIEQGQFPGHNDSVHWFAMPLAAPFSTWLENKSAIDIVIKFSELAKTLSELHALGICHRDIKPANILALDERLYFSDFGLVKYPERPDITPDRQDVGPKFTMAPEMRRVAAQAEGAPADVFSFAKTLWIALTGQSLGFDGQYVAAGTLALSHYQNRLFTPPLDELLTACTDNDPNSRPTMDTVYENLKEWISLTEDFDKRNLGEWTEIQNKLFPGNLPSSAVWTDIDSILSIIKLIGQSGSLNHTFFPNGGGMTIIGASRSKEAGLIELNCGFNILIKPKKLTFESFRAGSDWNYFRLEADSISNAKVSGAYSKDEYSEEFIELSNGNRLGLDILDTEEYYENPEIKHSRKIVRYLKGTFLFVSTASPYNRDSSTYDARHEKMTEDKFREYIRRNVNFYSKKAAA